MVVAEIAAAVVAVVTVAARAKRRYIMKLRVKWVRSAIGYSQDQKDTIRSLGLRKLQHTVEIEDNPAMRGMVNKVRHLVQVEEVA